MGRRRPIRPLRKTVKNNNWHGHGQPPTYFFATQWSYEPGVKVIKAKRNINLKVIAFVQGVFHMYWPYANCQNNDFRCATMPRNTRDIVRLYPPFAHTRHALIS